MGKNKLRRFTENLILPNVHQPTREEALASFHLKGKWHQEIFKNNNPLVLELGCGKGEYAVGMGQAFPEKNFLGVDIKGARFWFGAKQAIAEDLGNVHFLRTQIELIDQYFAPNEVDEIWITFPDPQIRHKRAKHRLTSPLFLERYKRILKPGGLLHLKTDSEFLHGYTIGILEAMGYEILSAHHDLYGTPEFEQDNTHLRGIQTYYEQLFSAKGKTITYIKFRIH